MISDDDHGGDDLPPADKSKLIKLEKYALGVIIFILAFICCRWLTTRKTRIQRRRELILRQNAY